MPAVIHGQIENIKIMIKVLVFFNILSLSDVRLIGFEVRDSLNFYTLITLACEWKILPQVTSYG